MDPNTTLDRIRALAATISSRPSTIEVRSDDPAERYDLVTTATELVECVDALDGWIAKGGFLPAAWAPANAIVLTDREIGLIREALVEAGEVREGKLVPPESQHYEPEDLDNIRAVLAEEAALAERLARAQAGR